MSFCDCGCLKFLSASSFLGSGRIPFLLTMYPRYSTSLFPNMHLSRESAILFLANFQIAAHRSAFHPVEKLNCIINLALNGVALSRDELSDPNFEKILKSCSSMLDIRKSAETNPGLVHQVFECLKTSKEVVEARVKLASLKENYCLLIL